MTGHPAATQPREAPRGTVHGTLRWYVHRTHKRNTRFGERRGPLVWVVTPIVQGRGSQGFRFGASTICADRDAALAHAHHEAERTYGPRKDRS